MRYGYKGFIVARRIFDIDVLVLWVEHMESAIFLLRN